MFGPHAEAKEAFVFIILSKDHYMKIVASLAAIANQLKELGADHGVIVNLQNEIDGIGTEIDDKIKAAMAGFNPGAGGSVDLTPITTELDSISTKLDAIGGQVTDLDTRMTAVEQGLEDLGGDADLTPPETLVTTPLTLSGPVGTSLTGSFSTSGGTAPYTYVAAGAPADVSVAPAGSYSVGAAAAENATFSLTVTDSASPSNTATETVTVTIA